MRALCLIFLSLFASLQIFAGSLFEPVSEKGDSATVDRAFDYFFLKALALKEEGRHDEAFELYEHCLELRPGSSIIYYELYGMYSFLGRKTEALDMMELAAEGDTTNYWYSNILATAYVEAGDYEKAARIYERMTRIFTSRPGLLYTLAGIYAEQGKFEKAIGALENIERIDGKTEQISLQKLRIYVVMQDADAAVAEMRSLVQEYPDNQDLKVLLGDVYLQFGDKESALAVYDSVALSDPENIEVRQSLADYYNMEGCDSLFTYNMEKLFHNDKFIGQERTEMLLKYIGYKDKKGAAAYNIDLLRRLAELPIEQSVTTEMLAHYLQIKEVSEDTIAPILKRLLELEPENRYAQLSLLSYAINRRNFDEMIQICDTALMYIPEMLELYYYKGVSYYNLDRPRDAITSFEKGLSMRSEESEDDFVSEVFGLLGDIYHEIGNMDSCMLAYDSALVYDGDNLAVLNNYAYYLTLDGKDLNRALEMSLKTINAEPENTTYMDTYMWLLFTLGRYEEAKAYAAKLVELEGDEIGSILLHHCGDVYAKCGEIDRAVEFWKMAQEKGDDSKLLKKKIKRRKYIASGKKKRN